MKSHVWAVLGVLLGIALGLPSGYALMQNNTQNSNITLQSNITQLETQLTETQTEITTLQKTNANLQQTNDNLQQANMDLQGKNANLQNNNTAITAESTNLKAQISQIAVPRLATRLGVSNCNWDSSDLRLYIEGEVWDIGTNDAENCSLHVTLYSGNFPALQTYVPIGFIPSGAYEDISENVHYSGFTLTNWTIVPECNP